MPEKLSIRNDSPKVLAGPQLLHELINWEANPESVAIDFTDDGQRKCYSYRETKLCVSSFVAKLQDALSSVDSRPTQHIIPMLIPQSPGLYISLLSILTSGIAFCPIMIDAPAERIKFIIKDIDASLIITTSDFKEIVTWKNGPIVITVDKFPIPSEPLKQAKAFYDAKPHDLAYIMYTSGSTGMPKGVRVSHLAASQSLLAIEAYIPPFKRFLQFAAPSFDVSVFEIIFPLIRASTLVGCNRTKLLDDLPGIINGFEIDAAELTPTVVGSLIQKRKNVPKLKLLIVVGEMLTSPIVKEFGGSKTQAYMLYGAYGPTEAAIHCTIHPKMEASAIPGNIGIPFDTVTTLIADLDLSNDDVKFRILPIGEIGELILSGSQLALGYLNREKQTKLAFFYFRGRNYYRTGDKARQLVDGSIEIYGRINGDQIKLRGQRVELGEIEEVVCKHPGINIAVAAVLQNFLIVFIATTDLSLCTQEIMKTCSKWLPKSWLPSKIILREKFPYLPSGKVDRKTLVSEFRKKYLDYHGHAENLMSETDEIIKAALHEFLGPFPRNSRLSSVGLDSLVAIKVASKLRASGINISAISVLQAQDLRALAHLCDSSLPSSVDESQSRESATKYPAPHFNFSDNPDNIESMLPCTPLQLAMLSETLLDEKAYLNWVEFDLLNVTTSEYIINILKNLAYSNPILRTGFMLCQDTHKFFQFIWKKFPEAQIEVVKSLRYEYTYQKDSALKYPVRFQILPGTASIKVLMHIHHALYDGWSLELLLDDLDLLLSAKNLEKRPSFENVISSYWIWENTTNIEWSSNEYWKDHLTELQPKKLPNFHTRKEPTSTRSSYSMKSSLKSSEIEILARKLSTSQQSIFQAAFALILSSYLGSSDICFGTVFSGRTLPIDDIESIIGPCFATLPLRIDLSTLTTLHDLVQWLHSTNRKHLEHSKESLRKIKAAGGFEPRQVLFDTLLIWQQTLHSYDNPRKNVSLVNTVDNFEFNLVLEVVPHENVIEVKANYQTQIFPQSQIEFFAQQVEQIVQLIATRSETLLSSTFTFLSPAILSIQNDDPIYELSPTTLYAPVEKMAQEEPTRLAISFIHSFNEKGDNIQNISYAKLNNSANQIAHHLVKLGTVPDRLICICLDKSIELYTSILGITKTGAGWLPVEPDTPSDRLNNFLSECQIQVVVTHSKIRPIFKFHKSLRLVCVDQIDFSQYPAENLSLMIPPDKLAYGIYTSGSTGRPKGVLVNQKNILSNLEFLEYFYPKAENTRFLQFCSQTFDVSIGDMFLTWKLGGCLCSSTKNVLLQDLEYAIRTLEITHLSLTPTVASLIDPDLVPGVKFLIAAGEAMTHKVFNAWVDRGLRIGYGPSEATNIVTITPALTKNDLPNNIGYPLKNTSAFVITSSDEIIFAPRGGEGELCFGGAQIFRGYVNIKHEDTKIINHPKYGRLYRTGDFGRLMHDGSFTFLGRKDDQVKIRGQRVELGEIDNITMSKNPEVRNCATILISNESQSNEQLICFWTPKIKVSAELQCLEPDQKTINKFYARLNLALPAYMIPSAMIPVSIIPTTVSGKADKSRLIALFKNLSISYLNIASQSYNPSHTSQYSCSSIESEIATTLSQITKSSIQDIGPNISFFSLGIDSVSAITFSKALYQRTGYHFPISDILKFPTVARLAQTISSESGPYQEKKPRQILPAYNLDKDFCLSKAAEYERNGKQVEIILQCTPLQEAILSAAELSSGNTYNSYMIFKISGNFEKLRQIWAVMVRRHSILRTCFERTNFAQDPYIQVVLKQHNIQFQSISCLSERKSRFEKFEPPYAFDFMQDDHSKLLVISMHHALYDGAALSNLFNEVQNLYHGRPLEPAVSFSPFLKYIKSMNLTTADIFWKKVLENCTFPKFKSQIESHRQSFSNQVKSMAIESSLNWTMKTCMKYGTSLLPVLMTIWSCILSERLCETDICFGNVVSGRSIQVPGVERLVAPCFNTVPIRLKNMEDLCYLEAFRKFQAQNAELLPFQFTPLRRIQSLLTPDGSKLFDTLLVLQHPSRNLDSSIWSLVEESGFLNFHLACEVTPNYENNTLNIILHSDASIFSEEDVMVISDTFQKKLKEALLNPRRPLLSLELKTKISKKSEQQKNAEDIAPENDQSLFSISSDEKKLRKIISQYTEFPIQKINRNVSLFCIGIDSVSSLQLASQLRQHGKNISVSDIFEHNTIAKLLNFFENQKNSNVRVSDIVVPALDINYCKAICSKFNIPFEDVEAIRPCTAIQQGMLARTLHSNGKEYMNDILLELLPETSLPRLKDAWITASKNHEIFRSGFASTKDSKYPFIMITYRNFILPWLEAAEKAHNHLNIDEIILHSPWSLNILQNEDRIMIRFTVHHALYDALSIRMFLSDVAKLYAGIKVEVRPSIQPLLEAIIVQSQNEMEEKEAFWKSYKNTIIINRFPNLTTLRHSSESRQTQEYISKLCVSDLEAKCRKNGVTMQTAMQAAWGRLLAFYIGQPSTTFGVMLSGRSAYEDSAKISFPTIVTLPVRCDIFGTNAELLERTMDSNSKLYRYQFTPLTLIKSWTGNSSSSLFDTLLNFKKFQNIEIDTKMPWKVVRNDASVDYTLVLDIECFADGTLNLSLNFLLNTIPSEQASIILNHFEVILLDLLSNPKQACDTIFQPDPTIFSITPAKDPDLASEVMLLHEFVKRGAQRHPQRNALEFATNLEPGNFQSSFWTYEELDQNSNKVANILLDHKFDHGEMIAVFFDKCPEASFAIIGALKAGCAYVALDINAPIERLKFMVKDSRARVVLTGIDQARKLTELITQTVICLDSNLLAKSSKKPPETSNRLSPEDVAYCLYTSGTTGVPKGCLITHKNAVQFMLAFSKIFENTWDETSKFLQFASFHFDVSVMEQFWSWSEGLCVVSAPRDLIFENITRAIQILKITHIDLTPSLARLINPDNVPLLKKGVFITGGERLQQEILDVWGEHSCIFNGYGPTEVTIGCTMYSRVPKNGNIDNIGPAYVNVGTFVMHPGTEVPVPRGAIGELCVSGALVGKGYLNQPELTAKKFPTLEVFNERVYRTGDLVRILFDGSFIFHGRIDDQIKLRGQRLELNEINEVISKGVNNVDQVFTLVLKHTTQGKEHLVSFFVPNPSNKQDLISKIKDTCRSKLPGYMIPTYFIPVEKIPLNSNNKINVKQLTAIYRETELDYLNRSSSNQQINHWSDSERQIILKIASVMDLEASLLARNSNLFELGLDSISIIGFSRALQEAGLTHATLSIIKNNSNISSLVEVLMSGNLAGQEKQAAYLAASQEIAIFSQKHLSIICDEINIESTTIETLAPCTSLQNGMIYGFLESKYPLYFNEFRFQLEKNVDSQKLIAAWDRVASRVEALRIKFIRTDDGFSQVILKKSSVRWQMAKDYNIMSKIESLKNPYCLSLKADIMTLQIFHGLYDGISLRMLLNHVINEYNSQENINYGPSFTSLLPYGPLARIPGTESFWRSHLEKWSPPLLPTNLDNLNYIAINYSILDLHEFESFRQSLRVTPQAIIQACWIVVLRNLLSKNLTLGIVLSGRAIDFKDADKVVGPLFNTVPFNVIMENGMSLTELILVCHEFNMKIQDFQHTPLNEIRRYSPATHNQPLFDSLFVFERFDSSEQDYALNFWKELGGTLMAEYPLSLEAKLDAKGHNLLLTFVTHDSFFTQVSGLNLMKQLEELLRSTLNLANKNAVSNDNTQVKVIIPTTIDKPFTNDILSGQAGTKFNWDCDTLIIRREIAALANVSPETVNENSSIFELGLDSIDVIKLSSRLSKKFIHISVSDIIKYQKILFMADKFSKNSSPRNENVGKLLGSMCEKLADYFSKAGKVPFDAQEILPATPLQQSMLNEMTNSDYKRYFNVAGFEISQNIDLVKLKEAIVKVIEASPILRTIFYEIDDPKIPFRYAQVIQKMSRFQVEFRAMTLIPSESMDEYFRRYRERAKFLAKKTGNLFFVHLADVDDKKIMAIAISHALYDGVSLRLIHEDINKAYNHQLSSRPDFKLHLDQIFQSTSDESKKFWKASLSNLPRAVFPKKMSTEIVDPTKTYHLEKRSQIPLSKIESHCKLSRITLQTLGQTCWALVLSQLMKQLDVVFGSVLSCRDSEEAREVMFPLINTVVQRSIIHGTLHEMLVYMQEISDNIRNYQQFPLNMAQVYALTSRESQTQAIDKTLFNTLFIYQGRTPSIEPKKLYNSVYSSSEVEFPVCVEMQVIEEGYLLWTVASKSTVLNFRETEAIIEALEITLNRIISSPKSQTILVDKDGISVCGLPKFKLEVQQWKNLSKKSLEKIEDKLWSSIELGIRKAVSEVSDIPEEKIRKEMTIFHLGLDSIIVLKLPAILKSYGINLSVSSILRDQTIMAMAKSAQKFKPSELNSLDIDGILTDTTPSRKIIQKIASLNIPISDVQYFMPATAGQYFMIRQWQVSRGNIFYGRFILTLPGPLNVKSLESAWNTLLEKHDILRTGFIEIDADLYQVVFKYPCSKVFLFNSNKKPPMTRKIMRDFSRPPVNLFVEKFSANQTVLEFMIHHALYDAISLSILFQELKNLYQDEEIEISSSKFSTFVAHSVLSSQQAATQENWKSYLLSEEREPSLVKPDIVKQETEVFIPATQIQNVKLQAQEIGSSVDSLFLAAIAKIEAGRLQRLSQANSVKSIIIGLYLANRAPYGEELSRLAAPTLNIVPLCVHRPLDKSLVSLALEIQNDIRKITGVDMVSASLAQIYEWTGVRVTMFVNILKSSTNLKLANDESLGTSTVSPLIRHRWEKIENHHVTFDSFDLDILPSSTDSRYEAYQSPLDIELYYHEDNTIDICIFGSACVISTPEAQKFAEKFLEYWT